MLSLLRKGVRVFQAETPGEGWRPDDDVIWIDLLKPTREEELAVEAALGVDLPTLDEMAEIEPSSRYYYEDGATFMTATLLAHGDDPRPTSTPVTFVLVGGRLVTLRYEELKSFTVFAEQARQSDIGSGTAALLGLLDAVIQRLADILEAMDARVHEASQDTFERPRGGDFRPLLTQLSAAQSVTALTRNSLVSLSRLLTYADLAPEIMEDPDCRAHLDSLHTDDQALTEHCGYLSSHIAFLLDAALGLINIEQNGIIKFFSVAAVVLMPPTLVASVYGMNFRHMPELSWPYGYPMALGLMFISAAGPFLWFRRRGWF